jgi:uncharacterized coiled-coil protein SlyX
MDDIVGELNAATVAHVNANVPGHVLWLVALVQKQEVMVAGLMEQLQHSQRDSEQSQRETSELRKRVIQLESAEVAGKIIATPPPPVAMAIPGRDGISYTRGWLLFFLFFCFLDEEIIPPPN